MTIIFDHKPIRQKAFKKNKRGSNQFRSKPKITKRGMCGAILVLLFSFITALHYTALGITILAGIGKAWASETFKLEAYAPTMDKTYAEVKPTSIPTPIPTPTKEQIIYAKKHADIIYRIYGLESSFGKYPLQYCEKRHLISDMGFNALNKQCFSTFQEEVNTVESWIESHSNLTLGEMLCEYSTGKLTGCDYKQNFLNL